MAPNLILTFFLPPHPRRGRHRSIDRFPASSLLSPRALRRLLTSCVAADADGTPAAATFCAPISPTLLPTPESRRCRSVGRPSRRVVAILRSMPRACAALRCCQLQRSFLRLYGWHVVAAAYLGVFVPPAHPAAVTADRSSFTAGAEGVVIQTTF